MTVGRKYNCDICGVERREANHWFVACREGDGLMFFQWDVAERERQLDRADAFHLCGQVCAHKMLDKFMATQQTVDS
jgi:hypothetical protein